MHRLLKQEILPLCLCLVLLLSACGKQTAETGPAAAAQWQPEAIGDVGGEESAPPESPDGETDGAEGSYYNDFLRETLVLDGHGACSISWPGGVMGGIYSTSDNGLVLMIADLRLNATFDHSGNLNIAGKQGSFLKDWDFWGITPAEAGIHPVNTLPDTEEIDLGGGSYRYRDFAAGLALTYDAALQIAVGRCAGAVTVADGKGGYVVGRNVTQRYALRGGSAAEFLEDYLRADVFSDAAALYAAVDGYDGLRLVSGEKGGRLAACEATLSCGAQEIAARVILYTSSFSDGTENQICKCVLAPAGETTQLDALAAAVHDMGAARIVQAS